MWSTREIIEIVGPRIPDACVGLEARSNLEALAERLPDVFSSYYLECRLAPGEEQVDFLACAADSADHGSAQRICASASWGPEHPDPAWSFAWDLLCRWASPSSGWPEQLPFVWLEFDHLSACPPARQSPSFGVCVDPGYPTARAASAVGDSLEAYEACLAFLAPSVPPAYERMLSADNRRAVEACFRYLPPGGRVIHVSFMAPREPATTKLYVAVPQARLPDYLLDIGWPGPLDSLRELVRTFSTVATADDTVYLDLWIHDALLPHAAFTFAQPQLGGAARSDQQRSALLALLEGHGLLARDRSEALWGWSGSSRESRPSGSMRVPIDRWLDVKITLHAEQGLGAKAYLGFAPAASMF